MSTTSVNYVSLEKLVSRSALITIATLKNKTKKPVEANLFAKSSDGSSPKVEVSVYSFSFSEPLKAPDQMESLREIQVIDSNEYYAAQAKANPVMGGGGSSQISVYAEGLETRDLKIGQKYLIFVSRNADRALSQFWSPNASRAFAKPEAAEQVRNLLKRPK